MDLALAGLILIAVAWILQLVISWKGNRNISPFFILCYMIGVLALVIADYLKTSVLSYFEFLTLLAAGLLLLRILTVKKGHIKAAKETKAAPDLPPCDTSGTAEHARPDSEDEPCKE